ncbi:MAG: DM13 domain-containing protein [Candidatus Limnocylindrales bacterium]
MPSIGDLANDVAHWLYEFRIPIAIASIGAVALAIVLARRLGWFAAARRHPRRTTAIVALVLLVTAPVGWYLGSPIFIRTSLVEAPPAAVAATPSPIPTRSPAPSAVASAAPTAPPTPSPTPFVPVTLASGEFHGTDEFHFGRGTASIIEIEPGRHHLRLDEFSVRNGPDLYVYLSPDAEGYDDGALELGVLKATDGSFGYDLPEGADPTDFASVLIWCKQFSHLFAVAPFGA